MLQTRTSSSSTFLLWGSQIVQYLFVLAQEMQYTPYTPDGAYYQQSYEIIAMTPAFVDG
jgi:hypothetical protein